MNSQPKHQDVLAQEAVYYAQQLRDKLEEMNRHYKHEMKYGNSMQVFWNWNCEDEILVEAIENFDLTIDVKTHNITP